MTTPKRKKTPKTPDMGRPLAQLFADMETPKLKQVDKRRAVLNVDGDIAGNVRDSIYDAMRSATEAKLSAVTKHLNAEYGRGPEDVDEKGASVSRGYRDTEHAINTSDEVVQHLNRAALALRGYVKGHMDTKEWVVDDSES